MIAEYRKWKFTNLDWYGVYASRIICFARACDNYSDFSERHNTLCVTLLKQGYRYNLLCKQLRSTYTKHKILFEKYSKSVEDIKGGIPLPIEVKRAPYITIRPHNNRPQILITMSGFWQRGDGRFLQSKTSLTSQVSPTPQTSPRIQGYFRPIPILHFCTDHNLTTM